MEWSKIWIVYGTIVFIIGIVGSVGLALFNECTACGCYWVNDLAETISYWLSFFFVVGMFSLIPFHFICEYLDNRII